MKQHRNELIVAGIVCLFSTVRLFSGEATAPASPEKDVLIEFTQNQVDVLRAGSKTWDTASTNKNNRLYAGDQLRTGDNSRVGLRLPGHKAMLILDSNS